MMLKPVKVSIEQYDAILRSHKLMPDTMAANPAAFTFHYAGCKRFWLIEAGLKTVGLVVVSDVVPGDSCSLHVIVDAKKRKYMRPERVEIRSRSVNHSRGKLRAFAEVLDYCFGELGVERITIIIPSRRRAAVRLARRLGIREEGRARSAISIRGVRDDAVIFGVVKGDF